MALSFEKCKQKAEEGKRGAFLIFPHQNRHMGCKSERFTPLIRRLKYVAVSSGQQQVFDYDYSDLKGAEFKHLPFMLALMPEKRAAFIVDTAAGERQCEKLFLLAEMGDISKHPTVLMVQIDTEQNIGRICQLNQNDNADLPIALFHQEFEKLIMR